MVITSRNMRWAGKSRDEKSVYNFKQKTQREEEIK
jgi:hypothetical protein